MDSLYLSDILTVRRSRLQQLQRFLISLRVEEREKGEEVHKRAAYFQKSVDDDSDDYVGRNLKVMLGSEAFLKKTPSRSTNLLLTLGASTGLALGVGSLTSNMSFGVALGAFLAVVMTYLVSEELKKTERTSKVKEKKGKRVSSSKEKEESFLELLLQLEEIKNDIVENLYEELLTVKSGIDRLEFPSAYKLIESYLEEFRKIPPDDTERLFQFSAGVLISILRVLEEIPLPSDFFASLRGMKEKLVRYLRLFEEFRKLVQDDELYELLSQIPVKPVELPEGVEKALQLSRGSTVKYLVEGNVSLTNLPRSLRRATLQILDADEL